MPPAGVPGSPAGGPAGGPSPLALLLSWSSVQPPPRCLSGSARKHPDPSPKLLDTRHFPHLGRGVTPMASGPPPAAPSVRQAAACTCSDHSARPLRSRQPPPLHLQLFGELRNTYKGEERELWPGPPAGQLAGSASSPPRCPRGPFRTAPSRPVAVPRHLPAVSVAVPSAWWGAGHSGTQQGRQRTDGQATSRVT